MRSKKLTKNSRFIYLNKEEYINIFLKLFELDKLKIITHLDNRWGDEFKKNVDVNSINTYTKLKKFKEYLYDRQDDESVWIIINLFKKGTREIFKKEFKIE